MNIRTTYMLLAILTTVGAISVSSALAQEACPDCEGNTAKTKAQEILLGELPISVWTDKQTYGHNDMIIVEGRVANLASGFPVTITVTSPTQNVVAIDQVTVNSDKTYMVELSTAGALWKYDGIYTIKAQYGNYEKSNKAKIQLTGGITGQPLPGNCGVSEISIEGYCVPFSITGGQLLGASINSDDKSIIFRINALQDGEITITPSKSVLDGIFMILVDGEEWDDVEVDGQRVTVMFPAGTETIELIGTFVVPEFGTIAVLILAVAIISIIAVSAKSRLSIMPRY